MNSLQKNQMHLELTPVLSKKVGETYCFTRNTVRHLQPWVTLDTATTQTISTKSGIPTNHPSFPQGFRNSSCRKHEGYIKLSGFKALNVFSIYLQQEKILLKRGFNKMAKLEKLWDRKEITELHGFFLLPKHQLGNVCISSQMWCKLEGGGGHSGKLKKSKSQAVINFD